MKPVPFSSSRVFIVSLIEVTEAECEPAGIVTQSNCTGEWSQSQSLDRGVVTVRVSVPGSGHIHSQSIGTGSGHSQGNCTGEWSQSQSE